jgi:hypothetical protein
MISTFKPSNKSDPFPETPILGRKISKEELHQRATDVYAKFRKDHRKAKGQSKSRNFKRGDALARNVLEKDAKALELRKGGLTYREIGLKLGCTEVSAWHAVRREQEKIIKLLTEDALEIVNLELLRLDTLLAGVWGKAKRGDNFAVQSALRIMERRAKLLGLDMPIATKLEGTGEGGAVSIEVFRRMVDVAGEEVNGRLDRTCLQ